MRIIGMTDDVKDSTSIKSHSELPVIAIGTRMMMIIMMMEL